LGADTRILASQVPGGMLSNLENQLKEQGASDKIDDVLKEIHLFKLTVVIFHLLHQLHKSLVHKLFSTYYLVVMQNLHKKLATLL
jgi:hypothetical protein